MSENNVMRGDPNRMGRPGSSGSSGGFVSGVADGAQGLFNTISRMSINKRLAKYKMEQEAYREEQTNRRAAQREASAGQKAVELENLRHQHKLEQMRLMIAHKKKTAHKPRAAKEHERIQMETGRFAPGMRNKTLSDGKTPNPYATFSPEQEATHIANIAKETGWEPAETKDMPEVTEGGGIFGGGTKIPAGSFTTYKPSENAGVEMAEPTTESQPAEE